MDWLTIFMFAAGLALLLGGADLLVRGAAQLATALGISPLVIGLTVVAYGTSAPEVAVSLQSSLAGQADLAVGNVVGSNIFNILFILGLTALVAPLVISRELVRLDVPIMIAVSFLLYALAADKMLGRFDGALLFTGIVVYTVWAIRLSRRQETASSAGTAPAPDTARSPRPLANMALVLAGLALLVWGSRWLVHGAVALAQAMGVSQLIIGLTIVAAGTSLPEIATSILASLRGERDIAIGNVVGSNISNILAILGITALVAPHGVSVAPAVLRFDLPVMIAVAVACLPIFFTGYRIGRREGALFFGYYLAYTLYLILDATGHDHLGSFSTIMLEFVVPITAVTILTLAANAWRRRRRQSGS